jgi:hypothetical protein
MKRDMEFMLTQNIVKAVGSTSGARATAGLLLGHSLKIKESSLAYLKEYWL